VWTGDQSVGHVHSLDGGQNNLISYGGSNTAFTASTVDPAIYLGWPSGAPTGGGNTGHTHGADMSAVDINHTHGVAAADAAHTHGITAEGGGGAHENMPPYYALTYIIKQ
jgi:microcystin-dependent protein